MFWISPVRTNGLRNVGSMAGQRVSPDARLRNPCLCFRWTSDTWGTEEGKWECSLFKLLIRLEYLTEICYIAVLTSVSRIHFVRLLFVLNIVIPLLPSFLPFTLQKCRRMWFQTWYYVHRRPKMKNVSFAAFQLFHWTEARQHARTHRGLYNCGTYAGVCVFCRITRWGHLAVTIIYDSTVLPCVTSYIHTYIHRLFIGKPCWNSTGTASFLFSSVVPFLAFSSFRSCPYLALSVH
jgi:hypothetical protein